MDEIKLLNGERTLDFYELILTENCNLRCKYCFDDSYSDRTGCNYNYVMPLSMIDDIINFIEKTKNPNLVPVVSFFGGEPLANWNFIKEFIKKVDLLKLNYRYSINTNVTLIDDEKLDFFIKNKFNLTFSVDGIKEAHNANRVFKDGTGSWDDIVSRMPKILTKLKANRMRPSIMMVISDNNCQHLERSYEFISDLVDDVNILWNYDSFYKEENYKLIEEQLISLFLIKKRKPYIDLNRKILNPNFWDSNNHCILPEKNATISVDGGLYFCHRMVPKMSDELHGCNKEKFGDIYKGFYNDEYIKFIKERTDFSKFKVNKECENCSAIPLCKGGCLGSIRNSTGGYGINPPLCRMERLIAKIFLHRGNENV